MAISRVPGFSLLQDLDRQGTDLQFTTLGNTLVYMDFSNFYVGINTITPTQALEVSGNVLVANGHVYTGANLQFDIGGQTNQWRTVYANTIQSVNLVGTLVTNAQPNITSLGTINNLAVTGNLNLDGNLIVNGISVGNLSANTITANVFGNITGYVLQGDQPFITNLGNITVSNITITGGEFDFGGDVSFETLHSDFIYQNNNPVLDSVSNLQVNGDVTGYGTYSNIYVALINTGVTAGIYGSDGQTIQLGFDSKGRVLTASNIALTKIGNLNVSNTTISSATDLTISTTTNGNIYLDAGSTGVVQITGSDAVGLPSGDDSTRPLYPEIGYTRYNTTRQSIEYYDGNSWLAPGAATISSEVINPDGTANTYILGSNTSVDSVLVSINGTLQQPIYSYNIVNNNQITFTETPLTSDVIEVRFIAVSATSVSSLRYGPATAVTLDIANVNVTGNVLPSANVTYSLGSESLQWKDLWISGNSIYIGGSELTVANGQLSFGGNTVGAADPYGNINVKAYTESMGFTNYSNVNVAAYTQTQSYTNYSNVNVAAYTQTQSYTNYSNVNLSAYLGGAVTIGGNLTVNGNLFVNGNLTTINANNLNISDSLIFMADFNPADTLDIGIVSSFTSAVRYQHTGFVRDATDDTWKLFANVVPEPTTTVDFTNATYSNLQLGNLTAIGATFTGNITAPNLIGTANNANFLGGTPAAGYARLSGATFTGNISTSANVVFSGWSVRETGTKLYFAYNGINRMSLDTGGNLVVTGDVTAFGTIT
jgi:hypothetical protein